MTACTHPPYRCADVVCRARGACMYAPEVGAEAPSHGQHGTGVRVAPQEQAAQPNQNPEGSQ